MMDGLPVDMAEEDVGKLLPPLKSHFWSFRATLYVTNTSFMARG
jgi:hypothetical protein